MESSAIWILGGGSGNAWDLPNPNERSDWARSIIKIEKGQFLTNRIEKERRRTVPGGCRIEFLSCKSSRNSDNRSSSGNKKAFLYDCVQKRLRFPSKFRETLEDQTPEKIEFRFLSSDGREAKLLDGKEKKKRRNNENGNWEGYRLNRWRRQHDWWGKPGLAGDFFQFLFFFFFIGW